MICDCMDRKVPQDSDGHPQRDLNKRRLHGEYKNHQSIHKLQYENKTLYKNYSAGRRKKKNPGHIKGKTQFTAARVSYFTDLNAGYQILFFFKRFLKKKFSVFSCPSSTVNINALSSSSFTPPSSNKLTFVLRYLLSARSFFPNTPTYTETGLRLHNT